MSYVLFKNRSKILSELNQLSALAQEFSKFINLKNTKNLISSKVDLKLKIGTQKLEIQISPIFYIEILLVNFYLLRILSDLKVKSQYVNDEFYKIKNEDVFYSGASPAIHFWSFGYFEGRHSQAKLKPKTLVNSFQEILSIINNKNSIEIELLLFENLEDTLRSKIN